MKKTSSVSVTCTLAVTGLFAGCAQEHKSKDGKDAYGFKPPAQG